MKPDRPSAFRLGRVIVAYSHRLVGELTWPRKDNRHSPTGSGGGHCVSTQRYRNQTPINRRRPPLLPSDRELTPTRPCPCRQTRYLGKRGADRVAENYERQRDGQSSADLRLEVPRLGPAECPRGEHQQWQPCRPSLQPVRDKVVSRTPSRSRPVEPPARPCIGPSGRP